MEEKFQIYISKIQSQSQEDLDIARACFELMMEDIESGPFLLEKCHSNEYIECINAILCLKSWVRNFWLKNLIIEQKQQLIDALFQLITINKSISSYIFDIFTFIIKRDAETYIFFHEILPTFLENFEFNENFLISNLLYFLLKLFTKTDEKEYYYLIYKQYFYPLFNDFSFLNTDDDFFKIFKLSIRCFSVLFFEIKADPNDIILPLEFCKYIISECNDSHLVSRCSKFFRECFFNYNVHQFLSSNLDEIYELHLVNIVRFIQNQDDHVVYNFLRTISVYGIRVECFEILIESASLTQENINDFYSNPFYFNSIFYTSSNKYNAGGFALFILQILLKDHPSLIHELQQLEIGELSMRIFGYLSSSNISLNEDFIEIRQSLIESVLPIKFENLIETSSKIYLILNSMNSVLYDESFLINLFFEYFDDSNDVIRSLLCKIVRKMKSFVPEIPLKILEFFPICQNLSALKALNHISLTQPEVLFDISETLVSINTESIQIEFNSIEEEDENDDADIDSGKINCNLTILSTFVEQFLNLIPLEEIISIVDHLLKYDFNEDTLYNSITNFINGIFQECSNNESEENYNFIFQQIMICVLNNLEISETKNYFIESYGLVFLFAISKNRNMFLNLEVSSSLIDCCIEILNSDCDRLPILILCDIISYIIQVDQSIDCDALAQLSIHVLSEDNDNNLFDLGFSDILASIIISKNDCGQIPPDFFISLMEKKFYARIYDKFLTAKALTIFNDESLNKAANELLEQAMNQNKLSENDICRILDELSLPVSISETYVEGDYSFPAPIQIQFMNSENELE